MKLHTVPLWGFKGGVLSYLLLVSVPVTAQITPDKTLPINSSIKNQGNTNRIEGGTIKGSNLFHSFEQFSVPTGSEAYFNNDINIQNIITRITGKSISNIDGILKTNGTANLLLINPNGIIFGNNAKLNIGGSFLATTASQINFADATKFSAKNPEPNPLLTISVPIGLEIESNAGAIFIQSSGHNLIGPPFSPLIRSSNVASLQVQPERTLAIVGGDVILEGGVITSEGGRIELGSVSNGSVSINPTTSGWKLGYEDVPFFQDIHLSKRALVDTSGIGSGSIQIDGRRVTLTDGSVILNQNQGTLPAGTLNVNASESLSVSGSDSVYLRWYGCLFLSILSLLIVVNKPSLLVAQTANKQAQHSQAQFLTKKGLDQLNRDQSLQALETWKKAENIYRQIQFNDGIIGSLINQSLALKSLGLYPRTCNTVLDALKMDRWICSSKLEQPTKTTKEVLKAAIHKINPTPVSLLGLQKLGDALRLIGKLDESETVLKEILSIAQTVTPKQDVSSVLFSLANTKESMYERAQNQYKWIEDADFKKKTVNQIQQNALFSLDYYQQVNNTVNISQSIKIKSQLRSLNILLDFDRWLTTQPKSGNTTLATVNANINQQIKPLIEHLLKNSSIFSQLPPSESVFAQLNFAESLNKTSNKQLQSLAIQYAESALQSAKSIDSQRLESYSLGTLGKLKPEKSQAYFESALALAQSIHALDIAYEWQQHLADVYTKQGKSEAALQAYKAAINNLTDIRGNLLASNPDTPFFFYEKVEPVYRSYMRLLLVNPHPNLDKVVQINEELQLAELENYLQCGRLDLVALNDLKNLAIIPSVIHIIDLGNSIEVVVQSPDKSLHHHSVDPKSVKVHADHLLQTLQDQSFANTRNSVILDYYQALYNSLIAPIKRYLPQNGTLVFTLDTSFQSLPMGLLHDGKDYLLKHYNIAETLGSKVRQPKLLPRKQLRALIAGLSKSSPSFKAANAPSYLTELPSVVEEIANVKEQTNSSLSLLNEEFTYKRFIKEVSRESFPIIHLTTHAQFNSVPQLTMFFSWDKPINLLEFDSLLKQKNQINEDAIELLVLSGCETAKGNKRSALGIAGIAAQGGARSTVATLWRVDDKSTALLMKEFYKELKDGKTKTEALRLAQLSLLSNPDYSHPYYWAGFLLIGGWL